MTAEELEFRDTHRHRWSMDPLYAHGYVEKACLICGVRKRTFLIKGVAWNELRHPSGGLVHQSNCVPLEP